MARNPIWAEARRRAFSETIELLRLNSFPRVLLTVGTPLVAFAATWGLTGQLAVAALATLGWMPFCGALIFGFKLISGPAQIAAEAEAARTQLEAKLSAEPPPHPHGIYQYRVRVGTAGQQRCAQEGELVFLWLQGGQAFNATIPFEYRDLTLMLERWDSAKSVWHGGSAHSTEYRPATCKLIDQSETASR